MTTSASDNLRNLSFNDAREVYCSWIDFAKKTGGEENAYNLLGVTERKVLTKALEVLEQNQTSLKRNQNKVVEYDHNNEAVNQFVDRVGPGKRLTNGDILKTITKSFNSIHKIGKGETVLTNIYLTPLKFDEQIDALHDSILKLRKLTRENVLAKVEKWVSSLDEGEDKEIAKLAFNGFQKYLETLPRFAGVDPENIETAFQVFCSRVALGQGIREEQEVTKADLKAIGGSPLDALAFLDFGTIKNQSEAFASALVDRMALDVHREELERRIADLLIYPDEVVDETLKADLQNYRKLASELSERFEALEVELQPQKHYPPFAGIYAHVVREHVQVLRDHVEAAEELLLAYQHRSAPPLQDFFANFSQNFSSPLMAYRNLLRGSPKVLGENRQILVPLERAMALEHLAMISAKFGANQGNALAALTVAKLFKAYGEWDVLSVDHTFEEAMKYADVAIENSQGMFEFGDLKREAMRFRADLLATRYYAAKENRLGREGDGFEMDAARLTERNNVDTFLTEAIDAYTLLGYDGVSGLFQLFVQGSPLAGHEVIELLRRHSSKTLSSDDIKILSTLALAGFEEAEALLKELEGSSTHAKNLDLKVAAHFVESGLFAETLGPKDEFDREAQLKCYEKAVNFFEGAFAEATFEGRKLNPREKDAFQAQVTHLMTKFRDLYAQEGSSRRVGLLSFSLNSLVNNLERAPLETPPATPPEIEEELEASSSSTQTFIENDLDPPSSSSSGELHEAEPPTPLQPRAPEERESWLAGFATLMQWFRSLFGDKGTQPSPFKDRMEELDDDLVGITRDSTPPTAPALEPLRFRDPLDDRSYRFGPENIGDIRRFRFFVSQDHQQTLNEGIDQLDKNPNALREALEDVLGDHFDDFRGLVLTFDTLIYNQKAKTELPQVQGQVEKIAVDLFADQFLAPLFGPEEIEGPRTRRQIFNIIMQNRDSITPLNTED